jgi:hypothetical protein
MGFSTKGTLPLFLCYEHDKQTNNEKGKSCMRHKILKWRNLVLSRCCRRSSRCEIDTLVACVSHRTLDACGELPVLKKGGERRRAEEEEDQTGYGSAPPVHCLFVPHYTALVPFLHRDGPDSAPPCTIIFCTMLHCLMFLFAPRGVLNVHHLGYYLYCNTLHCFGLLLHHTVSW